MKIVIKLLMTLCCLVFLSGCTPTVNLPLNYKLQESDTAILRAKTSENISLVVKDKRDIDNPRLIMRDDSAISGGYMAEAPLTTIVQNALSSGLEQMGYKLNKHSNYLIKCDILDISQKVAAGWVDVSMKVEIQLNIRVFDLRSHTIVWQNIIIGHGDLISPWPTGAKIKGIINAALTSAVRQLQTSRSFVVSLSK